MTSTPFLKKFNQDGGTLYVFPSVSKDLTRTFVSNDYEFKFSHFACLNIPNVYSGKYSSGLAADKPSDANVDDCYFATDENNIYRYTSGGWEVDNSGKGLYLSSLAPDGWDIDSTSNTGFEDAITENLQNYVMNFEAAILNGEGDNDDYDNDILTTVSEKVFFNWLHKVGAINFEDNDTEESYSSYADRTVQYIGNIDVLNTVEVNGDVFDELYIHIPSSVGATEHIYFRKGELTDNKNYLNKSYSIGGDGEKLQGRDGYTDTRSAYGLQIMPFVDKDNGVNVYKGDIGHTIDFRDSSYTDGINGMNSNSLEDFEFNAILIYYDIFKKTNKTNVKKTATNLYGILFLDNLTQESGVTYFQRYPKKRETVYGSGNSYVLKVDLKIDTMGDTNSEYEIIRDPNNGDSMLLYNKSLEHLQKCIDLFYTQKKEIIDLLQRVEALENLLVGIDSVETLKKDITRLYDLYDGNMGVDTAGLLSLINANSKKLNTIMNGGKDLKLQYDTDVLQPGIGIGMQKSLNKVVISSEDKYAINTVLDDGDNEISPNHMLSTTDPLKLCKIQLKPGENFAVIYMTDQGNSETSMFINVDDSDYNWSVGQSLKIYIKCENGNFTFSEESGSTIGIIVKPTSNTTFTISATEFEGNDLIEIVCVGENEFIYIIK